MADNLNVYLTKKCKTYWKPMLTGLESKVALIHNNDKLKRLEVDNDWTADVCGRIQFGISNTIHLL